MDRNTICQSINLQWFFLTCRFYRLAYTLKNYYLTISQKKAHFELKKFHFIKKFPKKFISSTDSLRHLQDGNTKVNFMLRILENVGSATGSETNWTVGFESRHGSENNHSGSTTLPSRHRNLPSSTMTGAHMAICSALVPRTRALSYLVMYGVVIRFPTCFCPSPDRSDGSTYEV